MRVIHGWREGPDYLWYEVGHAASIEEACEMARQDAIARRSSYGFRDWNGFKYEVHAQGQPIPARLRVVHHAGEFQAFVDYVPSGITDFEAMEVGR